VIASKNERVYCSLRIESGIVSQMLLKDISPIDKGRALTWRPTWPGALVGISDSFALTTECLFFAQK
jgi:hypothetical protein